MFKHLGQIFKWLKTIFSGLKGLAMARSSQQAVRLPQSLRSSSGQSLTKIVRRSGHWGKMDKLLKGAPLRWKGIVLHHSLTKDQITVDWKSIIRYHTKERGWSDVGYHFGIEKSKNGYRVYEGRSLSRRGAHVKQLAFNAEFIGICVLGNYDKELVPIEAWTLAQSLVEVLQKKFDIFQGNVIGHWEAQKIAGLVLDDRKTCPGKNFNMDAFRQGIFN